MPDAFAVAGEHLRRVVAFGQDVEHVHQDAEVRPPRGVKDPRRLVHPRQGIARHRGLADRLDQQRPVGHLREAPKVRCEDVHRGRAAPGKDVDRPCADPLGRVERRAEVGQRHPLHPRERRAARGRPHPHVQRQDGQAGRFQCAADRLGIARLHLVVELDRVEASRRGGADAVGKGQGGEEKAGVGRQPHRPVRPRWRPEPAVHAPRRPGAPPSARPRSAQAAGRSGSGRGSQA